MKLIYDIVTAAVPFVLDPPKPGSDTAKFMEILNKFARNPKMPSEAITFSPKRWYTGGDLTVIFKQLRGNIEHTLDMDRKEIGAMKSDELGIPKGQKDVNVGEVKKRKLTERIKDRIGTLKEVKDLLPGMVKDYKERLEDWKKKTDALEVARIKGEKDLDWVDNAEKWMLQWREILFPISEQEAMQKEMEKGVMDLKELKDKGLLKRETPGKKVVEKGTKMVEFTKFKALENQMISVKKDIGNWVRSLKEMVIPSPEFAKTAAEITETELRKKFQEKWDKPRPLTEKEQQEKDQEREELKKKIEDLGKAKKEEKTPKSLGRTPTQEQLLDFLDKHNVPSAPVRSMAAIEDEFDHIVKYWRESHPQGEEGYEKFMKFLNLYKDDKDYKGIPPARYPITSLAHVIATNLRDFKVMHSMYMGVLWSRSKQEEVSLEERKKEFIEREADEFLEAEEAVPTEEKKENKSVTLEAQHKEATKLKAEAIRAIDSFATVDVYSDGAYKKASEALKGTEKFIDKTEDYLRQLTVNMTDEQYKKLMEDQGITTKKKAVSELIRHYAEELGEQVLVREFDKIFPYEETKAKIKANCKATFKHADQELDEIYDFFKQEYIDPRPKLKSIADRLKQSPQDFLKERIPHILTSFMKVWEKHEEELTKSAPMFRDEGAKTLKTHPFLAKYLDDHIKSGKIPPLTDVEKVYLTKAIPRDDEFLNYAEKIMLSEASPAEFERKLMEFGNTGGGGGGGSGGGRHKEPVEIAQGMAEEMKRIALKHLLGFISGDKKKEQKEGKPAEAYTPADFVREVVDDICIGGLNKSDQFNTLDKGTVISVVVGVLRNIANEMAKLKISLPEGYPSQKVDPHVPSGMTESDKIVKHVPVTPEHLKKREEEPKEASGTKSPQFSPGEKEVKKTPKHLETLVGVGPWSAHSHGYDLTLSGSPEMQLEKALAIQGKINDLHKELEKWTNSTVDHIYPRGLLDSISLLQKDLKKGPHAPLSNPEDLAKERGKLEKERAQRKAADVLYDFPTLMSMNVASKFAGLELPNNEFDAVIS